jgi:uncharacterized protein YprB with RNaseH-like and TPR domain
MEGNQIMNRGLDLPGSHSPQFVEKYVHYYQKNAIHAGILDHFRVA